MAVAGSCCSGVVYEMRGGTVAILRTETRISSQFDSVTEAIAKLRAASVRQCAALTRSPCARR
jgi:hypothetical protein